ncbi:Holliday junction resolvase RuvX [Reticulibacter mediterranei]|uniref:Holliday junction resolvase RuvX n=1 Tax=Reticulibacter mediterranei TaxID=2778369 RepID=UPI001C6926B3|nr:Holliday junction resolvase RuvX [Reticulibacter mediterranei]
MTRLLALDVGEARIGVAISDTSGFLASPYTTLHVSRNEAQIWEAVQELIRETEAEGLVIGLPISLDGQIHAQARRVQAFAERLQPHISVPLTFWDERLSTVEAQRLLIQRNENEGGRRQRRTSQRRTQSKRRQRGQQIDALAAAVFLQDYLDSLESKTEDR